MFSFLKIKQGISICKHKEDNKNKQFASNRLGSVYTIHKTCSVCVYSFWFDNCQTRMNIHTIFPANSPSTIGRKSE